MPEDSAQNQGRDPGRHQGRDSQDRPDSRNLGESGGSPSLEDLARRLLDLWQEQMAAMAADPDLMRQMGLMMAASPFPAMLQGIIQGMMSEGMTAGGTPAARGNSASGPNPFDWWNANVPGNSDISRPAKQPEARPAAAAPASRTGGGELAELRRRLAGLEARLQELGEAGRRIVDESGPGAAEGGSGKPAGTSKSPGGGKSTGKPAGKMARPARRGGRRGSGGSGSGAAG
jgi:hypothetical protein